MIPRKGSSPLVGILSSRRDPRLRILCFHARSRARYESSALTRDLARDINSHGMIARSRSSLGRRRGWEQTTTRRRYDDTTTTNLFDEMTKRVLDVPVTLCKSAFSDAGVDVDADSRCVRPQLFDLQADTMPQRKSVNDEQQQWDRHRPVESGKSLLLASTGAPSRHGRERPFAILE